jgi:hypothetical protein
VTATQMSPMAFVPSGVIAVEAKVNERFDDLISIWTNKEVAKNPRSPPHREEVINRYAKAFCVERGQLSNIRYQLLQRTLCAALTRRFKGDDRDAPASLNDRQPCTAETFDPNKLDWRADAT